MCLLDDLVAVMILFRLPLPLPRRQIRINQFYIMGKLMTVLPTIFQYILHGRYVDRVDNAISRPQRILLSILYILQAIVVLVVEVVDEDEISLQPVLSRPRRRSLHQLPVGAAR